MKQFHKMISLNQIPAILYRAYQEFSESVNDARSTNYFEFKKFNRNTSRLDDFYFGTLKVNGKFKSLSSIIKLIFALGAGQGSVERRFSIKKTTLFENKQELSLISRRKIKDFLVFQYLTPNDLEISPSLIQSIEPGKEMGVKELIVKGRLRK